jgi:hypothetical protein
VNNDRIINLDTGEMEMPEKEVAAEEVKAFYLVTVFCENCGYNNKAQIDKGIRVNQSECPVCGCTGLVRAMDGPSGVSALDDYDPPRGLPREAHTEPMQPPRMAPRARQEDQAELIDTLRNQAVAAGRRRNATYVVDQDPTGPEMVGGQTAPIANPFSRTGPWGRLQMNNEAMARASDLASHHPVPRAIPASPRPYASGPARPGQ